MHQAPHSPLRPSTGRPLSGRTACRTGSMRSHRRRSRPRFRGHGDDHRRHRCDVGHSEHSSSLKSGQCHGGSFPRSVVRRVLKTVGVHGVVCGDGYTGLVAVTCLPQSDRVIVTVPFSTGVISILTRWEDPSEAIQTVVGVACASCVLRRAPASVAISSGEDVPVILVVAMPLTCSLPATAGFLRLDSRLARPLFGSRSVETS